VAAFPFPLPAVSSGLTALSPAARQLGSEAAAGAARALSRLLGDPMSIAARPLPAPGTAPAGYVSLPLALEGLPAPAALEVEATLACRVIDRLAGGDGALPPASSLTPVEHAALELLTLVALDGAAETPGVTSLAPRLARSAAPLADALCLGLSLETGGLRGRARLLLPARALRGLAGTGELPSFAESWSLAGSLWSGMASVDPGELAALAVGDHVVLDELPSPRDALAFPGFQLLGREEEGRFTVEDFTLQGFTSEGLTLEDCAMERPAASLPVTLAVEVARITLTLGELWRLEPGSALTLSAPRDGGVLLRLDGRPVARGQLVDVEGALGVRIDGLEGRP